MVVVGRIGSPYGVRGWLHVQSYASPPGNILSFPHWFLARSASGPWEPCSHTCKPHKKAFVAQIADMTDRDDAAALTGRLIAVPRDALPPVEADEYYWQDLIGMQVQNTEGVVLGVIASMLETGAHDVMVLQGQTQTELLVPFADPYLVSVDNAARTIVVNWDPQW